MSGPDWIPVLSQLKATLQLITSDFEGFGKTLKNFLKECPGVSQVTSVLQFVAGYPKGALETQKRFLGTISNVINIMPIVGHVKGVVQIIMGDRQGGEQALNAATRSTAVFYFTCWLTPITLSEETVDKFLICGSKIGVGYDIAETLMTGRTQGCVAVIWNAIKNPSAGAIFDAVVIPAGYGPSSFFGVVLLLLFEDCLFK